MKTIEVRRKQIDEVDAQLAGLLNRRARLAMEIGALKRKAGLPAYSAARERAVLEGACRASVGPLDPRAIRRLFRVILRESRRAGSLHAGQGKGRS